MKKLCERLTFALINEGARILEEGIASSPGDIDIVLSLWLRLPEISRRADVLCRYLRP